MKEAARIEIVLAALDDADYRRALRNVHPIRVIADALRLMAIEQDKKKAAKKNVRAEMMQHAFKVNRQGTA